jgi:hypothetical protein
MVLKTVEPYGVAMLSRYPFELLELHEMHSLMQRSALLAQVSVNGKKVAYFLLPLRGSVLTGSHSLMNGQVRVCTAHLESRDFDGFSPPLRKAQLARMFRLLDGTSLVSCRPMADSRLRGIRGYWHFGNDGEGGRARN